MALRISQANGDVLSTMVLAHRVSVRQAAEATTGTDEWYSYNIASTETQYALDVALLPRDSDTARKLDYLASSDTLDAYVALIRLEQLGIIADMNNPQHRSA